MNREIKFRAWDDKAMVENYAETGPYGELYTKKFHSSSYSDKGVPNLTLMQYTGLKDKNGKEIYEGDIVSYRGYRGVVKISPLKGAHISSYHPECASFEDGKEYKLEDGMRGERTGCPVGVIGNIYENPELLETK